VDDELAELAGQPKAADRRHVINADHSQKQRRNSGGDADA
jgi:hypothetical protein